MKRFLSVVLSVLMILSSLSVLSLGVFAEDTEINKVEVSLDLDSIDLNTACTEGEVNKNILDNFVLDTEGAEIDDVRLMIKYENWNGIGNGSAQVDTDKNYGILVYVELKSGYCWNEAVSAFTTTTPISECGQLELYFNGVKITEADIRYNSTFNGVDFYFRIGKASDEPIVKKVDITDEEFSLAKGEQYQFSADITGNAENKTIIWSVIGAESAQTVISQSGLLTIGADETAETISVKAVSEFNPNKNDSVEITVLAEAPVINSVTVRYKDVSVFQGSYKQFYADVTGTQTDKSVIWSVEGSTSDKTYITENGILYVGIDEKAETVTVKATANRDGTKFDTAEVTIKKLVGVSEVDITIDTASLDFSPEITEEEAEKKLVDAFDYEQTDCLSITGLYLLYKLENWNGIGNGQEKCDPDKKYAACLILTAKEGYRWIDEVISFTKETPVAECPELKITVNGVQNDDITFCYNTSSDYLRFYIPLANIKPEKTFPDVPKGAWFYDAAMYCANKGFINGYGNGNFGATDPLQRQDFVVILANIAKA
ncbi:MAG: hypothetical protein E7514_06905, partial [Ruminococcaceae bacterium]|nr:hypothetical protein [Oscillospiraceae bacterium]